MDRLTKVLLAAVGIAGVLGSIAVVSDYQGQLEFGVSRDGIELRMNDSGAAEE